MTTITKTTIKFNGREVNNPILRAGVMILAFLFIIIFGLIVLMWFPMLFALLLMVLFALLFFGAGHVLLRLFGRQGFRKETFTTDGVNSTHLVQWSFSGALRRKSP